MASCSAAMPTPLDFKSTLTSTVAPTPFKRKGRPMSIAIVTGASQGFGRALAHRLVAEGWTVVGDARDAVRLDAAVRGATGSGRFLAVPGDVTDAAHRRELLAVAASAGGAD